MILKCGVHNDKESRDHSIFVCHHCGMPVCEDHGWTVSADDAFDDSNRPVSRAAMHCPDCAEEKHKNAAKHRGWADPKLMQSAARAATGSATAPADYTRARAAGRP